MNKLKKGTPQKTTLFDFFKTPKKNSQPPSSSQSSKPNSTQTTPISTPVRAEVSKPVDSVVSRRLRIFWPRDNEWYQGVVVQQQGVNYQVKYDDGEVEWIDSSKEQYEFIDPSQKPSQSTSQPSRSMSSLPVTPVKEVGIHSSTSSSSSSTTIATPTPTTPSKPVDVVDLTDHAPVTPNPTTVTVQQTASPANKPAKSTPSTTTSNITPTTRRKLLRRLIASSDEEDGDDGDDYVPKNEKSEEEDDEDLNLAMEVETSDDSDDDQPIARGKRRVILDDSDSDTPIRKRPAASSKSTTTATANSTPSKKAKVSDSNPLQAFSYQASPTSSTTSTPVKQSTTPNKSGRKSISSAPSPSKHGTPGKGGKEEDGEGDGEVEGNSLDKKAVAILNAGEHTHDKTDWMVHPRDKYGNKPTDTNYDPTSLQVPASYVKGCTNGMKQWWGVKQTIYDCVLLMKVGKFYETYHMDADVMVKELDLVYMKGEMAHAGFPEAAYSKFSNILVNKGYRVARVEQTETPQMMKERNAKSAVKSKVVTREVCSILTPGVSGHGVVDKMYNQANHRILCSIVEERRHLDLEGDNLFLHEEEIGKKMVEGGNTEAVVIGLCVVDTVQGTFHLGQFIDDDQRTGLRTQLLRFNPTEFVIHKQALLPHTLQLIHQECPLALMTYVDPNSSFSVKDLTKLVKQTRVFEADDRPEKGNSWPVLLERMMQNGEEFNLTYHCCLESLYLTTAYLDRCCVANLLMCQRKFFLIDNIDHEKDMLAELQHSPAMMEVEDMPVEKKTMILDAITLKNLDILPDPTNPAVHSLFQYVDHTVTPFGKRLLMQWVSQPLMDIREINERLDAVEELISNQSLSQSITSTFKGIADIDRLLSRLHDYCMSIVNKSHPDNRAQYYEDQKYNTRKIKDFVQLLEIMKKIMDFGVNCQEAPTSALLKKILTVRKAEEVSNEELAFPDMSETLTYFDRSFNHDLAIQQGIIMPQRGMNEALDNVTEQLAQTQRELDSYLVEIRGRFGCQQIVYFGSNKDRFQLQFPDSVCQRLGSMPKEFLLKSQRKGVKRFWTPYITEKFTLLQRLEEQKQGLLKNATAMVFHKFSSHYTQWSQLVRCVAHLDVLQSLAVTSTVGDGRGDCVRPEFIPRPAGCEAVLELRESRHPCVINTFSRGDFIANDITLGGEQALCKIITGPNMGGKSTLLRQVAVSIILAQIGCFIPAAYMRLSPVDRIFTRIGAQDRILSNQSTFYVELIETSLILANCTQDSFLIIDELGRGTSTYDGSAIVHAVLKYLSGVKRCRLLFSTHYNFIITSFLHHPAISTGYMSYLLEKGDESAEEGSERRQDKVTFLYKLVEGICPDSFGINVARLANIPEVVLSRAKEMADAFNIDMSLHTSEVKLYMYKQLLSKLTEEGMGSDENYDKTVRNLLNNVI